MEKKKKLGLNVGKKNLDFFFFVFGWATNWAQSLNGARGSGPRKKTRYPKRAGSGLRALPRGSGPGMEKPGPNPTRCHSQFSRLVLTPSKGQVLTPRSYLLFFCYFNFVLVVLRQFWYQSKHRSILSISQSIQNQKKNHHKKKKIPPHRVFSTKELSLSFFYLVQES